MERSKFGYSKYNRPTPRNMRKLGDALLVFSTTVSAATIMTDHQYIALGSVLLGAFAKFLTNFFSKD